MRQNTSRDAADMTTVSEYVEKLIGVADATLTSPAWSKQRDYAETIALATLREVRRDYRKTPPWHTIAQMPKGVWMVTRGWGPNDPEAGSSFAGHDEEKQCEGDRDTWEQAVALAMLEGVVLPKDNVDEMDIDTLAAAVASVLGPESETIRPSGGSGIRGPDHLPVDVNAEELLAYLPTLNVRPQDHEAAVKRWTGVTRVPRGDDAIVDAVTTAKRVLQMATDGAYSPDEDEVPKEERTLAFGRIFKAVATNNSHPIIADEKGYIKGTSNGGAEFFAYGDKTPRGKLSPEQVKKVAREQVIWPPLAFYDESGTLMPPAMVGFNRAAIGLARLAREERRDKGVGDYGPATMFGPSKWSPDVKAPVSKGYERALSEREQAALDREHAARARAAEREERPPLPKGAKAPASLERYQPDHRDKAYQAYVSAPEGLGGKLFYVSHQGSTVSQHKTLGDAEAAFHRAFTKEASATVFDGTTGEFISWRDRAAKAPLTPPAKTGSERVTDPPGWRGIMLMGIERLENAMTDTIFALGDPANGVFSSVVQVQREPAIVPHQGEAAYRVALVRHKPGYREDGRHSDGAVLLFVPTMTPHWRVVPLGYKNGDLHYSDRVLSQGDYVARVSATKVAEARGPTSVSARKDALAMRAERITTEAARKAGSRASANATWAGSDAKGYTLRVKTRGFADSFVRGTLDEIEAKLTEAEQRARGGR